MNHVAVDLGSRQSQVCLRSADGTILQESKRPTRQLKETFAAMEAPARVVLETSSEAFTVAAWAKDAGHDVRIVPSTLSKSLGVGARGVKTDQRDARALSKVSCAIELESIHLPSRTAQERKALTTSRSAIVGSRTALINVARSYARTQVLHVPSGNSTTFPRRMRQLMEARPEGIPIHIDRVLKSIEALTEQIAELDKEVKALAEADQTMRLLMTMPGVGPLTALLFHSTIDDATRFDDAHKLGSYLGLTPGEHSSGESERKTGITHAGSRQMRWALVQAAWSAWRSRPNDPMVQWARKLATRRPKAVAIVALARKMAGILLALWKGGSSYTPEKGAAAVQ